MTTLRIAGTHISEPRSAPTPLKQMRIVVKFEVLPRKITVTEATSFVNFASN